MSGGEWTCWMEGRPWVRRSRTRTCAYMHYTTHQVVCTIQGMDGPTLSQRSTHLWYGRTNMSYIQTTCEHCSDDYRVIIQLRRTSKGMPRWFITETSNCVIQLQVTGPIHRTCLITLIEYRRDTDLPFAQKSERVGVREKSKNICSTLYCFVVMKLTSRARRALCSAE